METAPHQRGADIMWGVFERQHVDGTIHVCRQTPDGLIMIGHRFDFCECQPVIEQIGKVLLVIHKEES